MKRGLVPPSPPEASRCTPGRRPAPARDPRVDQTFRPPFRRRLGTGRSRRARPRPSPSAARPERRPWPAPRTSVPAMRAVRHHARQSTRGPGQRQRPYRQPPNARSVGSALDMRDAVAPFRPDSLSSKRRGARPHDGRRLSSHYLRSTRAPRQLTNEVLLLLHEFCQLS